MADFLLVISEFVTKPFSQSELQQKKQQEENTKHQTPASQIGRPRGASKVVFVQTIRNWLLFYSCWGVVTVQIVLDTRQPTGTKKALGKVDFAIFLSIVIEIARRICLIYPSFFCRHQTFIAIL